MAGTRRVQTPCSLLVMGVLFQAAVAMADVRLPHILSDHMVLQRDRPIPVWGWAAPGEDITVTLGDSNSAKVKADERGDWRLKY